MKNPTTAFELKNLIELGSRLSPNARHITSLLARTWYADQEWVTVTAGALAEMSGRSDRSVRKSLLAAIEAGEWIAVRPNRRAAKRYRPVIKKLQEGVIERQKDRDARKKAAWEARAKNTYLNPPTETEEKDGAKPDWLAEEEEEEEDTPLPPKQAVEEEETPKPVEASTSPEKITPTHSPQEAPEQPPAPLAEPVSAPSKTDAPDDYLGKVIERIIDTLSQPSRTKVEQDLAVKFKSHRKRPNTLLEGMEVLLAGAKETEKDIVEHLSLLVKSLPAHLQEVRSLPGWLRYFGGDNPAQHSKTSMSNSTSNSGSGAQSNLWGKHEDTKPDAEKYADFL